MRVCSSIAQRLRAYFAEDARDTVAVYLFGSQARGTAGSESDVDVAVLLSAQPPRTLQGQRYALEDDLQGVLGRVVQLVILNTAPPDLIHRVLRDGELVLDNDRAARIRFEVAARNAYFDLKPYLDRYRRAV